uniref:peroxidase n=1 Tax=Ananas comosus var. bracteatus TaxID=296719 RepID=A0A6V7QIJ7_ANACO|nr:unnamed protein product [Ananas comosus var. bracteatus]
MRPPTVVVVFGGGGALYSRGSEGDGASEAAATRVQVERRPSTDEGLSDAERMILEAIRSKENMGIWTFDLKKLTNLPRGVFDKALRLLQQKGLIKCVVSIHNKSRKMYVAREFEPAKEISGGTWYSQGSLNQEFIGDVRSKCLAQVTRLRIATVEDVWKGIQMSRDSKATSPCSRSRRLFRPCTSPRRITEGALLFYLSKAEDIVRSTVQKFFNNDSSIVPGLLRLHFHDCFVQGGDASVLISGSSSERIAVQNLGLRGFEVVDDAKSQLEAACPGVVSCADILALAARDAVDLTGGPSWSRQKFADKGLTDHDLVTLVGAHTIGRTDCLFFRYRLYNFTATGNADQTINGAFLGQLQMLCPQKGNPSKRVALDKDSMAKFDVSYFKNVRDGNAVLESDQRLWGDVVTQNIVHNYAGTIRGCSDLGLIMNSRSLWSR